MQQDFAELTIAAVDSVYGQLSSQVYASLAYTGRRTLQEIVKSTRFSTRQVGASLVVLVQHFLVKHHTTELGQTYYQADGEAAYNLVFRFQKVAKAVGRLLNEDASLILHELALRGHASVVRIQDALCNSKARSQKTSSKKHKRNGELVQHVQAQMTVPDFHKSLRHLLEAGYVILVKTHQFLPNDDLTNDARSAVLREHYGKALLSAKDKVHFATQVNDLLQAWHNQAYVFTSAAKGQTEALYETSGSGTNGTHQHHSPQIKHDLLLRLNYEKCSVLLRNEQLVRYVHRHIGETTSRVYRALLEALDHRMLRCYGRYDSWGNSINQAGSPWPNVATILRYIPSHLQLQSGLARPERSNGVNGHSSRAPVTISSDESDSSTNEKDPKKLSDARPYNASVGSKALVELHLRLLEQDPRGFVRQVDSGWSVPFQFLTRSMLQYEIENTVAAQHGQLAARVVRILHKNLSNDEKGLATAGVVKPKDIRSLTNTLLSAGIITTQEIPRDTNRTTNRLLWLYAYSPERARLQILNDAYRAMVRLLRRLLLEKKEYSGTIEKAERTDVVGHEDEYLNEKDRDLLEQWDKKEAVILGQISRIDDLVACMRDFAPPGDLDNDENDAIVVEEE